MSDEGQATYKDLAEIELRLTQWLVDRLEGKADRAEFHELQRDVSDLRENALKRVGPVVDDLQHLITRVENLERTASTISGERIILRAMLATALTVAGLAVALIIHYL